MQKTTVILLNIFVVSFLLLTGFLEPGEMCRQENITGFSPLPAYACQGIPVLNKNSGKSILSKSTIKSRVDYDEGRIEGRITSADGNPIANAIVYALAERCGDSNTVASGKTDIWGAYSITRLSAGTYYLSTNVNLVKSDTSEYYVDEFWNSCNGTSDCNFAEPVILKEDQVASNIDFLLDKGGSIEGRITSADGSPLKNVCLYAHTNNCGTGFWFRAEASSDADGDYSIKGVPAGTFYVSADASCDESSSGEYYVKGYWAGRGGTSVCSNASPITVKEGQTVSDISFSLEEGGRISGRVTGINGEPVSNVCIRINSDKCLEGDWLGVGAITDDNGTYSAVLPAGTYIINTDSACSDEIPDGQYADEFWDSEQGTFNCNKAETVTITSKKENSHIDFLLEQGSIVEGNVTDADGAPLANVCVYVHADPCSSSYLEAVTDVGGNYSIAGVPPGTSYVSADASCGEISPSDYYVTGYWAGESVTSVCSNAAPLTLEAGQNVCAINLSLEKGGIISGEVKGAGGYPVENACIRINNGKCLEGDWLGVGLVTDDNGTYLVSVPPGTYYINTYVSCEEGDPSGKYVDAFWNDEGGTYDCNDADPLTLDVNHVASHIDFSLKEGGSIEGKITNADGVPLANACVYAHANMCGGYYWSGVEAATDAGGNYSIAGVPPGTSYVSADASCSDNSSGEYYVTGYWNGIEGDSVCGNALPITLDADQTVSGINIFMEEGGRISGQVKGTDGYPVENVCIRINNGKCLGGDWLGAGLVTGDNGMYSVTVPAGIYYINTDAACSDEIPDGQYKDEFWDSTQGTTNCNKAEPVTVLSNQETANINFLLTGESASKSTSTTTTIPPCTTTTLLPDQGTDCEADYDCDDGLFCTGEEKCDNGNCVCGGSPCFQDEICVEDVQECWGFEKLTSIALRQKILRPEFRSKRCPWLVLVTETENNFDREKSRITINCNKQDFQGVVVDESRKAVSFEKFILIPLCIDKDATVGQWQVVIETDIVNGENSFQYIIEGNFEIL